MNRTFLAALLALFVASPDSWALTRSAIITEANSYKDYAWTCQEGNLQDVNSNDEDDRTGWPYKIDTAYTGEAYAFYGGKDGVEWGYEPLTGC